jgi:hypothetical protein
MVIEEVHQPSGETSQRKRRNGIGAPDYAAQTQVLLAEPAHDASPSQPTVTSMHR